MIAKHEYLQYGYLDEEQMVLIILITIFQVAEGFIWNGDTYI